MTNYAALVWLGVFLFQAPTLANYFGHLVSVASYRWLPAVTLVAVLVLLLRRWDWKFRLPAGWLTLVLTLSGLGLSTISALARWEWISILGMVLAVAGFLGSQRERTESSLFSLLPLSFALIRPPFGGLEWANSALSTYVASLSCDFMQFFGWPHIKFDAAIAIPGMRIYPEQALSGFTGWPLFVTVAMLNCCTFRRNWMVVLFDLLAAFAACVFYHVGVTVALAYVSGHTRQFDYDDLGTFGLALHFVFAFLAWVLFLSAERGFRSLVVPIPDGLEDSRKVNPLVIAWNRFFSSELAKADDDNSSKAFQLALMALPILMVVTGVAQVPQLSAYFAPASGSRLSVWLPSPTSVDKIWTNSDSVDFRSVDSSSRNEWGGAASVWTNYLPSRVTDFVVSGRPQPWRELRSIYAARGWEETVPSQTVEMITKQAPLPIELVAFKRDSEFAILCYSSIGIDGQVLTADTAVGQPCHMVQTFSKFSHQPSEAAKNVLVSEFLKLIENVRNDFPRVTAGPEIGQPLRTEREATLERRKLGILLTSSTASLKELSVG